LETKQIVQGMSKVHALCSWDFKPPMNEPIPNNNNLTLVS